MRPRKPLPGEAVERLGTLLNQVKSAEVFRRVQCVWLRVALSLSAEQIARATGLAPASVRCYQSRYMRCGEAALLGVGRGGRRRENLTVEGEAELLRDFLAKAHRGGVMEVGEVKAAYEKVVGHRVAKSTVYRMLARHGWRKIAPRPRHPDSDPARQEKFKKNSPSSLPSR